MAAILDFGTRTASIWFRTLKSISLDPETPKIDYLVLFLHTLEHDVLDPLIFQPVMVAILDLQSTN